MKIVAARLNHETNTFSPVPTPLASFGPDGPTFGDEAYRQARGTRTALGAFIEAAERRGADVTVAVNATANPSGRVDAGAYEPLAGAIVEAVRAGCDAILLDLHGAMVTERFDDGEGELLQRVRAVAPNTPLAVALDLHGNVTQAMIDAADVIVGFKTYPHIDMAETGAHAARLLFDWIDGGARPHVAWAQPPLLSHTLRSATGEGAMQRAVERARQRERDGLLAATVFAGFSLADFRDAGVSVVAVGGTRDEAQGAADDLAHAIWQDRDGFVYSSGPLAGSVAQARALQPQAGGRPVLLLDHGDNVMSGGTCDTTDLLEECLRQGLSNIGVGPLCDPAAVAAATAAGLGATVELALGNVRPLGLGTDPRPRMRVRAEVRALTDGRFRITGPIYTGETWAMGRTAVLAADAFTAVVTERPMEPLDLGVFTSTGLDPARFDYLLLKSRMYCRPSFGPIAGGLIECDSRGVTSSDYALFRFERVRRPIHPLDADARYA
ncbi:MAG TPA: M81 family metallopeptidase [Burkholderiaceae bacterium]|nr:M81 family metallopeptidase [Burkholderiaceae bacterium]